MPQEVTYPTHVHANRPALLSILCVLGFVGSMITIIQNGIGFFKAETEVAQIQSGTSKTQLKNLFSAKSNVENNAISNLTPDNFQKFSVGEIVASLLCIIGVVLMWLYKKSGFYSFTLGTFFNLITHFLLFGENVGAMGLSLLWALGCLLLVILYSKFLNVMD